MIEHNIITSPHAYLIIALLSNYRLVIYLFKERLFLSMETLCLILNYYFFLNQKYS